MEICKEVFFGGLPSLQLLYYHNSIYVSIAKKENSRKSYYLSFDSSISLISASSDLLERKSGADR